MEADRLLMLDHMRQNQVILSAITIIGRAPDITTGRRQLGEFILTLDDRECSFLIYALAEMLCLKLMETTDTKDQWFRALEKSGEMIAYAIESLQKEDS